MEIHELKPSVGAKHSRKRVGRGLGSGHGAFSGRGCKGDKSRAGGGARLGYEGGQLPLIQRLPRKRGFTNIFRVEFCEVNVGKLNIFESNTEVDPAILFETGLVTSKTKPIKILGDGNLDRPLKIKANKFSESAKNKIVSAGGTTEEI
jgi:large subunit ribosomal protein L15